MAAIQQRTRAPTMSFDFAFDQWTVAAADGGSAEFIFLKAMTSFCAHERPFE
jgi:hypothetical protein